MKPRKNSKLLLGVTRSKAKMYEYNVPLEHHIKIYQDPANLLSLSIGLLGDLSSAININADTIDELKKNLLFSAQFFNAYLESNLNSEIDNYLCLLGSASYYLCEMPGSALVLAERIGNLNLFCDGLESLLIWILKGKISEKLTFESMLYSEEIDKIYNSFTTFFNEGTDDEQLLYECIQLRARVYKNGSARQLLFIDIIAAITKKKLENSTWRALPNYSNLSREKWESALKKDKFVKELWPAQHLLGKRGILQGVSAVIQMPTSAGKTKATEFIIRSALLSERTSFIVIVAPFKALCHEIKNSLVDHFKNESIQVDELSDSMQIDFDIDTIKSNPYILIVTPEKLLYVTRHDPTIASHIGLAIFDEGHQFDSGLRGINYELLLTSLRSELNENTQKILISAVISNAEEIAEWLNNNQEVVEGSNLITTSRSIGFASWTDKLGRIEYIDNGTDQGDYYVPRIIESINLGTRGRERKDRFFPEKENGSSIALYLGYRLVKNGGIAIFCGKKMTAVNICKQAIDSIERGLLLKLPIDFSDKTEIHRLHKLFSENIGTEAAVTKCALHGIFSHHGNTPHGIRLAIEYAMQKDLIRFVICTSTLAQGVNLPIRYLIVTGFKQGKDTIKIRDFHNLIGRAGRSGMHTEGSILFSDTNLFDKKNVFGESWRWEQAKNILNPENSEACKSNILSLFEPITNDDKSREIVMEPLTFVKTYIEDPDSIKKIANVIYKNHGDKGFSINGVQNQISWRMSIISSIESFILSNYSSIDEEFNESKAVELAKSTLAFYLATDKEKNDLCELFIKLSDNIIHKVSNNEKKIVYGKTLYGVMDSIQIEEWIDTNIDELIQITDEIELLDFIWPILKEHISTAIFHKFDNMDILKEVAKEWICGKSYQELFEIVQNSGTRMIWGTRRHDFEVEHIIEVCEGAFTYDGGLFIGAIYEFVESREIETAQNFINFTHIFQKQIKYGLNTITSISAYELGFSDRVIAQHIAKITGNDKSKLELIYALKLEERNIVDMLKDYPEYYSIILQRYIS